ncbi:L-arabinitol 4-dehydrogenase [Fusarium oxysporum f. sp. albedinis]|nr:L-arabinitol 4-dehydrogenase [Fusarium oxysporum f. sp. albedinis]
MRNAVGIGEDTLGSQHGYWGRQLRSVLAISPPFVLAAHLMCIVASFRVVSLFNAGVAAPVLAWGRHLTRWEVLWTFNLELSPWVIQRSTLREAGLLLIGFQT